MNHFKIIRDLNGTQKCDICEESHVSVAKLAVDGCVVHPWNICQKSQAWEGREGPRSPSLFLPSYSYLE